MRRILVLLSLIAIAVFARPASAEDGDPPSRVARLSYITGKVSFEPSGEDQWNQASPNYPMTTGDRLYTDNDGRAELETGNIAIRMAPDTDLSTTTLSDQLVQLGLAQGTLRVRAYDIAAGNSIEIDTPSAALTLLRAGSYRVETYPDGNTTLVAVNEGDLEISGAGINRTLHAGEAVKLTGTDDVRMDWISIPDRDDFDQWCGDRDRRFMNSNSRRYVSDYTPGYADLDEYGSWDNAREYGRVWYPAQVSADWVPYRNGRWVWVEPWGWTWVEEEPWGFAPFHYGRWVLIGRRWGWVPGPVITVRPVYAPALVAFVGGPNADIQVWFPLGPRDPYFPWYHHSDVYRRQVNVTNVREINIVNVINVRNVENVRYTYQRIAPTACNTETFRGSRPVGREFVRVNAYDMGRARIIPHPEIRPDERSIHAGSQEEHPPVERIRPHIENRGIDNRIVNARPEPRNDHDRGEDRGRFGDRQANDRSYGDRSYGDRQVNDRPINDHHGEAGNPGGYPNPRANNDRPSNDRPIIDHHGEAGNPGGDQRQERLGDDRNPRAGDGGRGTELGNRNLPGRDNPPPNADNRDVRGREPVGGPYRPEPAVVPQTVHENPQPAVVQQIVHDRPQPAVVQQTVHASAQPAVVSQVNRVPDGGPPQERRPLVNRNPAPPQNPPFSQRQPAMQDHPGRPLEPQQMENIRRGDAAGPRQDREVPSHGNSRQSPPPAKNDSKQDRDHDRR